MPAPIETLTEFNIAQYLQNLPSGLTVGQAAHSIPKYRSGMMKAMRRTREQLNQDKEKEANYVGSDEEPTTAAKCTLRIHGKIISAIVDSEAVMSIMTKPLMQRLGFKISRPSKIIVITANGSHTKSLGIVNNVPISCGKLNVNASFQILESKDEVLILENE